LPRWRRKSSSAASVWDNWAHASGRRVWITVSPPMSFLGRLSAFVATSPRPAVCVVKPRRLAAAGMVR
jgi:hypothetical protein